MSERDGYTNESASTSGGRSRDRDDCPDSASPSKSDGYTNESASTSGGRSRDQDDRPDSASPHSGSRTLQNPQNPLSHSTQPAPPIQPPSEEQSTSEARSKRLRRDQDSMQTPQSIPSLGSPNRRSLSPLPLRLPSHTADRFPIQETDNNRSSAVLVSPNTPVRSPPGQELVYTPTQPLATPEDEELVLCPASTMSQSYGNNRKRHFSTSTN